MIDARFVPITQWPGEKSKTHQNARFRVSYIRTLDLLEAELKHLRAREITVQCFYTHEQMRNDGWPKANQKPSYPGVILSFKAPNGPVFYRDGKPMVSIVPLSFPCDTYWHLEHNLHAIALSLEALRAVDRYGVTKRAEQYAGWKQIEAPSGYGFASKEEAAMFMATQAQPNDPSEHNEQADYILRDADWRNEAYRRAVKRLHPDAGGDHELFVRLQQAKAMLEAA
jgi:hypothetical protein